MNQRPTPTQFDRGTPTETLAGTIERVTFHNAETGFCVLRVKVRGQRDLVTVVGAAAMISPGEFVQASGSWVNDRQHGLQFKGGLTFGHHRNLRLQGDHRGRHRAGQSP